MLYLTPTHSLFTQTRPTLKHQRVPEESIKTYAGLNEHYVKGVKKKAATKFRKGACENCGAMTHKKKVGKLSTFENIPLILLSANFLW